MSDIAVTFGPGQPGAHDQISELASKIPGLLPRFQRMQAELQDLRWVAQQMVSSHDHAAARMSDALTGTNAIMEVPRICLCALCRHARQWVTPEPRYCDQLDEREAVS